MIWALAIQALAFAVHLYRYRGQGLSPDGRFYARMAEGELVPQSYSRRWFLPLILKRRIAWVIASGAAWLATGPLIFALTGSLYCAWFAAWLPGLAVNVRWPVLVDQVAFALMLAAVIAHQQGMPWLALPLMFIAGQVKEPAPLFGAVLCMDPAMAIVSVASVVCALVVGYMRSVPGTEPYQLQPFRTAITKHDPLSWVSMVLPWGGVTVVCMAMASEGVVYSHALMVAGVSLAMGYAQLLLANDEARLFVWAAPAVLIAIAGYDGLWLGPAMCAHPFLCGAAKRV